MAGLVYLSLYFRLGLSHIRKLTDAKPHDLRVYLNTSTGAVVYTEYEGFVLQSAAQKYKMELGRPNEAAPIGECIG